MTFPFLGAFGPAAMLGGNNDIGSGTFDWLGVLTNAGGNNNNYSITNQSFGAPNTTRLIICVVHWISGSSEANLASGTIGGVAATVHVEDAHSGGSTGLGCAIMSALVPTGLTGTVTLAFPGVEPTGVYITLFRATNLVSNTPNDTLEVQGLNDTDINGTIDVPANGALLIAGTGSTNTVNHTIAFTGATEIYDQNGAGGRIGAALSTGLSLESNRSCRFNMGTISDSGTEMMACSWQLNA